MVEALAAQPLVIRGRRRRDLATGQDARRMAGGRWDDRLGGGGAGRCGRSVSGPVAISVPGIVAVLEASTIVNRLRLGHGWCGWVGSVGGGRLILSRSFDNIRTRWRSRRPRRNCRAGKPFGRPNLECLQD